MLSSLSEDMLRDPYPLFARLRESTPLLHDGASGLWFVFDQEGVRRALTDHECFGSAVAGGTPARWLIFTDPPRHTQLRALIMRAFTPRAVEALEPRVRALSRELLTRALERAEWDFVSEFSVPLPMMVIASMLGAEPSDWPRFKAWSDAVLGLAGTVFGGEQAARAETAYRAACADMQPYVEALVEARARSPRDDLLTRMLGAEVEGARLSLDDVLAFVQLLLLAGHETTTNLLGSAVLSLLDHPDAMAALRAEPSLLRGFIEEVLRHRAPVQIAFRKVRRPVELHGQRLPEGAMLLVVIAAANRDPRFVPDPDRFAFRRGAAAHLSFGHGIHFCLGAALARLEARVALGDLLAHTRALALAGPWTPRRAVHVHGPEYLPLRVLAAL